MQVCHSVSQTSVLPAYYHSFQLALTPTDCHGCQLLAIAAISDGEGKFFSPYSACIPCNEAGNGRVWLLSLVWITKASSLAWLLNL